MLNELAYPFDADYILNKKKSIRRALLSRDIPMTEKRVAILGGSTTHDIAAILELFLLNHGIRPSFYESEYAMYWEDAMFGNDELKAFSPDLFFIHTTSRNITSYPAPGMDAGTAEELLNRQIGHFTQMWDKLSETYGCPIIQNNFEQPYYRLMGNMDVADVHGKGHYIHRLNSAFYDYAASHPDFHIHDINYLASSYGLHEWADPSYWHMYKYALSLRAIPEFCHSLANIIKSLCGKNKKAFVLDLDNTLWGGVIGDDGPDGITIGPEVPMGQVYSEFQDYLKGHLSLGVMLNVCSKNEEETALSGLKHPDCALGPDDFILIKANWEPKDQNVLAISAELGILPESLVFVDDNPAEREIVEKQIPGVAVPDIGQVEQYIRRIDGSGFFEVTSLSGDDENRVRMYKENLDRAKLKSCFTDYAQYLKNLEMEAVIEDFTPLYIQRIAQLTNKSNQFNLTTRRYSAPEMEAVAKDPSYIRLCGRLRDKFGDNGVVSVVIGKKEGDALHIILWLMSCRVLKRDMECAMLDKLVLESEKAGLNRLVGYYYPTAKNAMVREFYGTMGFEKKEEPGDGSAVWELSLNGYQNKNNVIKAVNEYEQRQGL